LNQSEAFGDFTEFDGMPLAAEAVRRVRIDVTNAENRKTAMRAVSLLPPTTIAKIGEGADLSRRNSSF
jgi:hypothetical protein